MKRYCNPQRGESRRKKMHLFSDILVIVFQNVIVNCSFMLINVFVLFCFSCLTLAILKERYMAHVKCDLLSSEEKRLIKEVVKEEVMKIQVLKTF